MIAPILFSALALSGVGVNIHPSVDCPKQPTSVGYVRLDRHLDWGAEPRFDACMDRLRAAGIQPIAVVVGDTNPATYAASLAAMAKRWPATVWEIWNEENHAYFWPGTQAQYMELLKAASPAIREADPLATVLLGGLSWEGTTAGLGSQAEEDYVWLERAYKMGLRGLVDGIAIHPYEHPSTWASVLEQTRLVQWANRDPVPLWLTEFGWWGASWAEAEELAADTVARYPFVQTAVWYDLDGLGI